MEMELVYKERNELKAKIEAQGIGAPTRWIELATSAMAGNKAAKAECAELLGREVKTMLDLYNIQSAAFDVATPGERRRSESSALRALNTGHSAKNDANAYLANRLGSIRREKGMTQKELAKNWKMARIFCSMPGRKPRLRWRKPLKSPWRNWLMGRALDLVGQRFGRLLVLERVGASIPGVELPEIFLQKNIYSY